MILWKRDELQNVAHVYDQGRQRTLVHAADCGPWDGMSDPEHTAVGSFGFHLLKRVHDPQYETARHVETLRAGAWGVLHEEDGAQYLGEDVPVMRVRRRWSFHPNSALCHGTVEILKGAEGYFIKEPKVGVGSLRGFNNWLIVRDKGSKALRGWIANKTPYVPQKGYMLAFTNPQRKTAQITTPDRRSIVLKGSNGRVVVHLDSTLNKWLPYLNLAPRPLLREEPKPYCHCDNLRPSWEIIRRPGSVAMLAHDAGTGGAGFHDCLCAYRRPGVGMRFNWTLNIRFYA